MVKDQSWCTDWNEKYLNGSTMKDRSDDPSHHERTLLPRSYISLLIQRHLRYIVYILTHNWQDGAFVIVSMYIKYLNV